MHILHLLVPPYLIMHALPPQRLQRIVHIRQRHPAVVEQLGEHALIGELVRRHVQRQLVHYAVVDGAAGVDHLEPAVGHPEGGLCGGAVGLRARRGGVLGCEGAVFGDPGCGGVSQSGSCGARTARRWADSPVFGVMRFLPRIAHACMTCGKHPVAPALHLRRIQFQIHQFIHVLPHEHVAIKLHHALILRQAERRQLTPAVVEARVVTVVFVLGGEHVVDAFLGNPADVERMVAFRGKGVGVEGDEGVFRVDLFQGVVEEEEAGEVVCVGDEGGPDFFRRHVACRLAGRHRGEGLRGWLAAVAECWRLLSLRTNTRG